MIAMKVLSGIGGSSGALVGLSLCLWLKHQI